MKRNAAPLPTLKASSYFRPFFCVNAVGVFGCFVFIVGRIIRIVYYYNVYHTSNVEFSGLGGVFAVYVYMIR